MQILISESRTDQGEHVVLLFGLGMIGTAIRANLLNRGYRTSADIEFLWDDPDRWQEALNSISYYCLGRAQRPRSLSLAWSAGKAGLNCTEEEACAENELFVSIVEFFDMLRQNLASTRFSFHLVSSAGGLFEGQRLVGADSIASPLRPYGRLKLGQEQALQHVFDNSEIAIYRPSSVYGPMVQNAHKGLINNLVNNGLRGAETVLDAHVMSLRDYVYSGDVGKFIADCIRSDVNDQLINFLVSSRCSSIYEVVQIVQRVLKLRLRVRFDESFGNHRSITFSHSLLPVGWSPASLNVGVRHFVVGRDGNRSGSIGHRGP